MFKSRILNYFEDLEALQTTNKTKLAETIALQNDQLAQLQELQQQQHDQQEQQAKVEQEQQLLSLNQLELALNPGSGGVGIYAGLNPKVATDAIAEMKIFDLSEVDREPRALVRINPKYPLQLARNRISGRVDLSIVIDDTGRITDHSVKRSTHQDLTREVLRVIGKWKFSPAIKDGRPVTVRKIQPFLFGQQ